MPVFYPGRTNVRVRVVGSTSGPTTGSSTPSVIPEMTTTVIVVGGNVGVEFDGSFVFNSGDSFDIAIYRDGVIVSGSTRRMSFTDSQGALDPSGGMTVIGITYALISMETPGSHVYDVRWSQVNGTARCLTTQRSLEIVETSAVSSA